MRDSNNPAVIITNRRDREGDIDALATFPASNGFEVFYALSPSDAVQNQRFFIRSILGQQKSHGAANRLNRRVAVYVLGPRIPGEDNTIKGLADNRIFRGLYNSRQMGYCLVWVKFWRRS